MQLDFVFINSKRLEKGNDVILYTCSPYYLVGVYKFEEEVIMQHFLRKHEIAEVSAICDNYNIVLCSLGTLDDLPGSVQSGHSVNKDLQKIIKQAKNFYEEERVKGNESRLRPYAK